MFRKLRKILSDFYERDIFFVQPQFLHLRHIR